MSFCATIVDEWVRAGVTDAVIAPGSRSTPLAVALATETRLRTHVILDERSAAFTALGIGLASGIPAILVCTSGTAATHFHGAVVEASQASVPLIVCTADRPPELRDVGAPQTIDQVDLFGRAVRWAFDVGVADPATAGTWRSLASRAVCEATGMRPGPVHLNLMFREPLLATGGEVLPPGRPDGRPWHHRGGRPASTPDARLVALFDASTRPILVTGDHAPASIGTDRVPILSDHRGPIAGNVAHWDLLVRSDTFRESHRPDLVIRSGAPPASKALAQWLADLDVPQVALLPAGRWIDPHHRTDVLVSDPVDLHIRGGASWSESWIAAGDVASRAIDQVLATIADPTEPGIARTVLATRPPDSTLVVSSSMPVRDLEWFGTPRSDVRVLANRGANGIDGVTSTAVGVALTGVATTLLIGDLAFLHDGGALLGLAPRNVDLTIVVVDNDGGGIFTFLPQHDALDPELFERLFGTPHGIDLAALAGVHGIPTTTVTTVVDFERALAAASSAGGVRVVHIRSDRRTNVDVHDRIAAAVDRALQSPR